MWRHNAPSVLAFGRIWLLRQRKWCTPRNCALSPGRKAQAHTKCHLLWKNLHAVRMWPALTVHVLDQSHEGECPPIQCVFRIAPSHKKVELKTDMEPTRLVSMTSAGGRKHFWSGWRLPRWKEECSPLGKRAFVYGTKTHLHFKSENEPRFEKSTQNTAVGKTVTECNCDKPARGVMAGPSRSTRRGRIFRAATLGFFFFLGPHHVWCVHCETL